MTSTITPVDETSSQDAQPRILVFGDVMDDIIVSPQARPNAGTDTDARIQHRACGSAANTAAWLGSLGVDVRFVGRVGVADVQRHSQLLHNAGVDPDLTYATNDPTGTAVITVEGGARSMLTDRGASAGLDLERITVELLKGVSIVHFTGYDIVHRRTPVAVRRLISRIRAAGALVSIDPASAGFIRDFGAEAFLDLVDGADLFFPSLPEGRLLTGLTDPAEIVGVLAARFGVVAVPSADGSAVAGRHGAKTVHVPAVVTRSVDPIGAGDAFSAGFLSSWLTTTSLALATRRGTRLSAQALAGVGGRPRR